MNITKKGAKAPAAKKGAKPAVEAAKPVAKGKPAKTATGIGTGRYRVVSSKLSQAYKKRAKALYGKRKPDAKPKGPAPAFFFSKDDEGIWIYDPDTGNTDAVPLPYTLQDGDVITCYDPDPSSGPEPEIEEFTVQDTETGEIIVDYDCSGGDDSLEVDYSVLDAFEENYDPGSNDPYECNDSTGSFGING